ncbi:amidohydrolase family protein [Roseibacterium sp. SDUM158017]|uniref:amidohydrolase family protein n=1 Tax=Roseicyclus salinarum TaxID=3036773 RepID=UPI002415585B|nr:amidohydrolase family protein [Roseibacterium sp. SDUM158017]MDG4650530.1 amidohydrolase family protein [Roseibacterium sp. SDUM158017]
MSETIRLPGVGVPRALLANETAFGGGVEGDLRCGTLVLRYGRAERLDAGAPGRPERLVLPRLTEAHVHLDKCHSFDRCAGVGGDLAVAIAAQARDKAHWTAEDLAHRAGRGLDELIAAGCGAVRSHVDWTTGRGHPEVPLAWEVLGELAADAAERGVTLQRAALTAIDEMADHARAEAVARRVARDDGVLGSFLLDQPDRREGLRVLFAMADRFGLPVDFHVDEGLDPSLDGLELIADVALETRFAGPVLCGHACSLASRGEGDVARIGDKLAAAGIAVASLPTTNLYLQGRRDGTPDRRGLTRLHELAARGVAIVIGTDNVRDAFCPIGRHDPLHSLSLAVLAGHLDPPFGWQLPTITTDARRAMGLAPGYVDSARAEDLLVFEVPSLSSLVAGAAQPFPLTRHPMAARTGHTHA